MVIWNIWGILGLRYIQLFENCHISNTTRFSLELVIRIFSVCSFAVSHFEKIELMSSVSNSCINHCTYFSKWRGKEYLNIFVLFFFNVLVTKRAGIDGNQEYQVIWYKRASILCILPEKKSCFYFKEINIYIYIYMHLSSFIRQHYKVFFFQTHYWKFWNAIYMHLPVI